MRGRLPHGCALASAEILRGLVLLLCESGQPRFEFRLVRFVLGVLSMAVERLTDILPQLLFAQRFFQESNCTVAYCTDCCGNVATCGNDNRWQGDSLVAKVLLEFQAAHAGQLHFNYQAAELRSVEAV